MAQLRQLPQQLEALVADHDQRDDQRHQRQVVDAETGALSVGGAVKIVTAPEELKAAIVSVNNLTGHIAPGFGVVAGGRPKILRLPLPALRLAR